MNRSSIKFFKNSFILSAVFFLCFFFYIQEISADKCVGSPSACGSLVANCATCGCSYTAGSCANNGSCAGCGDSGVCSSCSIAGCSWDAAGPCSNNGACSSCGTGAACATNCGTAGCSWDAAGPCSNNGSCASCGTSGTCTSCSAASCSWDAAGPCSNNGNCSNPGNESSCNACSGCSWSSACPSIYSFNKEGKKVLEEETVLGLINKKMEKYHYEDLEYAQPQNGELKIIIQEDVSEVGHFNDIKLDIIDANAKQVFMAPDGSPQTVNNLQEIISCKSKNGEDCLKQILKQDSKPDETLLFSLGGGICFMDNWRETAWTTQNVLSLDFSKKDDLRDWIEIELPPAPSGAKTAKLIVSGSDTGILSFAEVEWVNTSKENVELFFDLSDNTFFGDHWAKQVYRVVTPKIQIQDSKGKWVYYPDSSFDKNILSTYDTVVFALDVSLIKNNRVRIESMAYTYVYDFVGVDYSESEFIRHTISPSSAIFNGEDVVKKLNKLDEERLMLTIGERVELTFQLPEEEESLNRSYHIQVAGYYQPSRRLGEGEIFYKSIIGQIKEEGLFGFIKKTAVEIYDIIMTSTNFNYGNRRFLIKYLQELKEKGLDPNSTLPMDYLSCNSFQEKNDLGGSLIKDISILSALFIFSIGLIILYRKKTKKWVKILIIVFALIILIFLIDSIMVRAACSGTLNCTGYGSQSACTACGQCAWDPEGPCSGTLNCSAIGDSGTCTGCGQCAWDSEGPCSGTLTCSNFTDSGGCTGCSQCSWDPADCYGSLNCVGLSEGNCSGCSQCSWTAASCSGSASACSTHTNQTDCSNCGCTWNITPVITGVSLNGGSNITTLIEGSTTSIMVIATTTDSNGYADITAVSARIYRSGVSGAPACTLNDNDCYEDSSCATSSCSGNSCKATCYFNIWFHADPTDIGTWSAEKWTAWVQATDSQSQNGSSTNSSETVDMTTIRALDVTNNISYGEVLAGSNTGSSNQTTTVSNMGNSSLDVWLYGEDMAKDTDTIAASNQQYSLSAFTFGDGTALSTATSSVNLDLSKPTSHPSTSTDDIYWGLGVPVNTKTGIYNGTNTFEAVPAI